MEKKEEKWRGRLCLPLLPVVLGRADSGHEKDEGKDRDQKWVKKVELQHRVFLNGGTQARNWA